MDSLAIAQKLDFAFAADRTSENDEVKAEDRGNRLQVLIEVRLSDEKASKSGAVELDLGPLAKGVAELDHLRLLGLMTIPPFLDDPERVRPYFFKLRELRDAFSAASGTPTSSAFDGNEPRFRCCDRRRSYGIRIGTALFGERAAKA